MSRTLDTRIQNKCDTADNWKAVEDSFIPLEGELIIYTDYKPENVELQTSTVAIKYGDGKSTLGELPFVALGTSGESAGKLAPIDLWFSTTNGEYKWYDPQDTEDAKWLGTIVIRTDAQVEEDLSIVNVLSQESAVVVVHYQGERDKYRDTIYADITRKSTSSCYYFYAYTDKGVYSDVVVDISNGTVTNYIDPPVKKDSVIYYNGKEHNILKYITNWNDIKDLVTVTNNKKTDAKGYSTTFTLKDSNNIWTGTSSNTYTLNWTIKKAQVENFIVEHEDGTEIENPLTIPYNETVGLRYKPEFNHVTTLEFGDNVLKPWLSANNNVTVTETKTENGYIYFNLHSKAQSSCTVYISVITNNNISAPTYELEVDIKKKPLNDYTWAEISEITKSGKAKEYWSVGDMKTIRLKEGAYVGTCGPTDVGYMQISAYILGFNHDDDYDIHFSLLAPAFCFIDDTYGKSGSSPTSFMIDTTQSINARGWLNTTMRGSVLGQDVTNPPKGSFLYMLANYTDPDDPILPYLRPMPRVNSEQNFEDYLSLPSVGEIAGDLQGDDYYLDGHQYEYFQNNVINSKGGITLKHSVVTSNVDWWTRTQAWSGGTLHGVYYYPYRYFNKDGQIKYTSHNYCKGVWPIFKI